jgi:hypothetical protein
MNLDSKSCARLRELTQLGASLVIASSPRSHTKFVHRTGRPISCMLPNSNCGFRKFAAEHSFFILQLASAPDELFAYT